MSFSFSLPFFRKSLHVWTVTVERRCGSRPDRATMVEDRQVLGVLVLRGVWGLEGKEEVPRGSAVACEEEAGISHGLEPPVMVLVTANVKILKILGGAVCLERGKYV